MVHEPYMNIDKRSVYHNLRHCHVPLNLRPITLLEEISLIGYDPTVGIGFLSPNRPTDEGLRPIALDELLNHGKFYI
jgi:hypothetical protein